jgi:hypothetical protein
MKELCTRHAKPVVDPLNMLKTTLLEGQIITDMSFATYRDEVPAVAYVASVHHLELALRLRHRHLRCTREAQGHIRRDILPPAFSSILVPGSKLECTTLPTHPRIIPNTSSHCGTKTAHTR